jgi:ketosteroid isomerase-like protein
MQLRRNTEQKNIKTLIDSLLRAWEEKDLQTYIRCWASDAVRVVGPTNTVVARLPEIEEGFKKSVARYRTIRVLSSVIEAIDIRATTPNDAVVEAYYRFRLTREPDLLPVYEEATEFYVLRRTEQQGWQITSNLDHSKDVAR